MCKIPECLCQNFRCAKDSSPVNCCIEAECRVEETFPNDHFDTVTFDFSEALNLMKRGYKMSRIGFRDSNIYVAIQFPTPESKMTKPYFYMYKREDMFSIPLSCESLLADDWFIVE